ncbi:hypothetical protein NQ317_016119 [Molorchus minor]|uniref:E2F/DP family winged-helix DNA-binding domain-containing protein n=1 Tax=Molorchus minor TaxID=1323400 RepID=A0ABQ9JNS7_9CUCU|nr:hypothetical protein NQ317_016119 [Molorchus minor]
MPRVVRHAESPRGYKTLSSNSTPDMNIVKNRVKPEYTLSSGSTPDISVIKTEIKEEYTPSPHLLDHGYGATPISQVMSSSTPSHAPASQYYVPSVVPIIHEFKAPQPKKPRRQTPVKKNTRYDTSLSLLTEKSFLIYWKSHLMGFPRAKCAKRRIYDITNVLEGIGILEKKSKNNIQWKGGHGDNSKFLALTRQIQMLEDQENTLDKMIISAETELRKLNNDKYGYVTYHDLRSIDRFRNKTVMAIKAPPNTQLSVPTGENQTDRCSIQLKSESGEIDVFLCPENISPIKPKSLTPMDPLLRDLKLSPGLF